MAPHRETVERLRTPLVAALREKYRLVALLIAMAIINLASHHFRGYGLSGEEMVIGTLVVAAALVACDCVHAVWEARAKQKFIQVRESRQDQS